MLIVDISTQLMWLYTSKQHWVGSTLKSFGGYGCDYLNPGHVATIMGIWTKPNGELRTNDSWVAAKKQKTKKKQQTRLGHDKPRFHKFRQIPLWFHWSGIASADCRF